MDHGSSELACSNEIQDGCDSLSSYVRLWSIRCRAQAPHPSNHLNTCRADITVVLSVINSGTYIYTYVCMWINVASTLTRQNSEGYGRCWILMEIVTPILSLGPGMTVKCIAVLSWCRVNHPELSGLHGHCPIARSCKVGKIFSVCGHGSMWPRQFN